MTRQRRSTLVGLIAPLVALTLLVAVFGTAIVLFVPIGIVRVVVGGFLLTIGLRWWATTVLRPGGATADHATAIDEQESAALRAEPAVGGVSIGWALRR